MASRWMESKVNKLRPQMVAAAQAELTKACYFTSKPEVPAYDPAMVKRVVVTKRARKTTYKPAPAKTLVQSGIGTIGSWDRAGESRLIKRG